MRINIFVIFIPFNQTNKHKTKKYNHYAYTQIILKKYFFFFTEYKNEWKEHKFF